jgi:hypothetical protein
MTKTHQFLLPSREVLNAMVGIGLQVGGIVTSRSRFLVEHTKVVTYAYHVSYRVVIEIACR